MKTLIVTGGTGGLGTTVVQRLSRDYQCVLLRHSQVDLMSERSIRDALAAIDAPYGLVHMAGGYAGGAVSETSSDDWQRMIGLNLTSSFFVIREALKVITKPGRIVAISSAATVAKVASAAAYTIAKTGLNTLIELTAAELAGTSKE